MIIFGLGVWFWSLAILEFFLLLWFVEADWPGPSFISVIVFIGAIWWLADIPIWKWIHDNPGKLALYCAYYIGIGMAWTFVKYYFVLKNIQKFVIECKEYWVKNKHEMNSDYTEFKQFLRSRVNSYDYKMNPDFNNSAKKLVFWASFWPSSMVWTLLNDPIKKLFKFLIFDVFVGMYRAMHYHMVGRLIEDKKCK